MPNGGGPGGGGADGADDGDGDGADDGADDGEIPEVGCDGLRPGLAPLRRMSDVQYRNTIDDLFYGAVAASDDFPPTSSAFAFSSEPDANLVTDLAAEQLLLAAEDVGDQVIAAVADVAPCAGGANEAGCAAAFLDDFGPRAFRRPLRTEERDMLLNVFDAAAEEGGYADGIGRMVAVTLQMPAFVYFIEEGVETEDGIVELSDHEVASRLSYLLWDTLPDDTLREAAFAGELGDPDEIEAQTRRLLADPRSTPALARFNREWLGVRQLRAADKDVTAFPGYGEELIEAMDEQFERYIAAAFHADEPTLENLLTSSSVEVDATLAPLYGLPTPNGWTTETLDDERRSGILTLPAFLASHASNVETSVVHRGLEIRTRVLCQSIAPPPPGAEAMGAELPPDATEAEKTQALLDNPTCGACHQLMNPIGMAFEHYDAIGAWRETYSDGEAIETEWDLVSPPEGLEPATFDGAPELASLLAGSEPIAECFVENWMHHAYGTAPGGSEVAQCALDDMTAAFRESGDNLPELVVHMTRSDAFRYRDVSEEGN
ncbi:MAG: DUF1592 domain-containing protein [Myxococcota bacterium]